MEKLKKEIEDRGGEDVIVLKDEHGYHAYFTTDHSCSVGDLKRDGSYIHGGLKQLRENCLRILNK